MLSWPKALLAAAVTVVTVVGPAGAAELRQVATMEVPGVPLESFDVGTVDQSTNRYYLSDRNNKAVDIFDGNTNKFLTRVPGFVGFNKSNDTSGPNGVLLVDRRHEAWVGDGDSTLKVIDLETNSIVDTVATGGTKRADELAYDDDDQILIATNNAEEPAFVTLISTGPGHKILARITLPDATDGIEQPVYYAPNGMFYMSVPQLKGDKTKGGLAVIDPRKGQLVKVLPVDNCIPAGLVRGPGANLALGCNAGGKNTGLPPVIVVVNAETGAVVKSIAEVGAADMVAYNPKVEQYYIAARLMPGGPVLGVIDAASNTWVHNVPVSGYAHSVAVSQVNNHVMVPLAASGGACGGCVGVYAPQ